VWKLDPEVLYPPVYIPSHIRGKVMKRDIAEGRENLIVTLGVFEPSKRHDVVIEALSRARTVQNARLLLVGSPSHDAYLHYLYDKIKKLNVKDRVKIMVDADEEMKWFLLSKAKAIVHPKIFEPFGIAVAEGMYAGAIPIVYKGSLSGPWIDIVKRGRYGLGFKNLEELSDSLESVIENYEYLLSMLDPTNACMKFTYEKFKENLMHLLSDLLT